MNEIDWVGIYKPEYKVSPYLYQSESTVIGPLSNENTEKDADMKRSDGSTRRLLEDIFGTIAEGSKGSSRHLLAPNHIPESEVDSTVSATDLDLHTSSVEKAFAGVVDVILDPGLDLNQEQVQVLSDSWSVGLQAKGLDVYLQPLTNESLRVLKKDIHASFDTAVVIDWLSQQSETHWIEPIALPTVLNKWARKVAQGINTDYIPPYKGSCPESCVGELLNSQCDPSCDSPACAHDGGDCLPDGQTLLEQYGLDGSNQIIGVGDSGIDVFQCFFYDAKHSVTYLNESTQAVVDSGHRKILAYYGFIDTVDDSYTGHGTHVCGTIAGASANIEKVPADYNGMAPAARLFFTDVGCSAGGMCECTESTCPCSNYFDKQCPQSASSVYMPTDLVRSYFLPPYMAGARIHSSSIGGSYAAGYSSAAADIDRTVYYLRDYLIIVAAGNTGKPGTISNMGQAKNALTVGATMSGRQAVLDQLSANTVMFVDFEQSGMDELIIDPALDEFTTITTAGSPLNYQRESVLLKRDVEKKYCEKSSDGFEPIKCSKFKSIASTEICCAYEFELKSNGKTCEEIKQTVQSLCCVSGCLKEMIHSLNRSVHEDLFTSLGRRFTDDSTISGAATTSTLNIASFSSQGPTMDGRIKPDLVASGSPVISGKSFGNGYPDLCASSADLASVESAPNSSPGSGSSRRLQSESGASNKEDVFQTVSFSTMSLERSVPVNGQGIARGNSFFVKSDLMAENFKFQIQMDQSAELQCFAFESLNNRHFYQIFDKKVQYEPNQQLGQHSLFSCGANMRLKLRAGRYYLIGVGSNGNITVFQSPDDVQIATQKSIQGDSDLISLGGRGANNYPLSFDLDFSNGPTAKSYAMSMDTKILYNSQQLKPLSGTSMATPVVAGHAALVRQYFMMGFYPSGRNNSNDSLIPSAALLKSVLINSAEEPPTMYWKNQAYTNYTDRKMMRGHGSLSLESGLYFHNSSFEIRMILPSLLAGQDAWVANGRQDVYSFSIQEDNGVPLKMTLVWTDPPASPASAVTLINNLDLVLILPNGTAIYGNNDVFATNQTADFLNNVEKISLSSPPIGRYSVKVIGAKIPQGPQQYALVVTGRMDLNFSSFRNISLSDIGSQAPSSETIHTSTTESETMTDNSGSGPDSVTIRSFKACKLSSYMNQLGGYLEGGTGSTADPSIPISCRFKIKPDLNDTSDFRFVFLSLQIAVENNTNCERNGVYIYDGDGTRGTKFLGRFCGSTVPKDVTASSNVLTVILMLNDPKPYMGFSGYYSTAAKPSSCSPRRLLDESIQPGSFANCEGGVAKYKACPPTQHFTKLGGHIEGDRQCLFTINPIHARTVSLEFLSLNLPEALNCDKGYVKIFDGNSARGDVLGKFCGHQLPATVTSTLPSMTVQLVTSSPTSSNGFSAVYSANIPECKSGEVWSPSARKCLSIKRECHLLESPALCDNFKFIQEALPANHNVQAVQCESRVMPSIQQEQVVACSDAFDVFCQDDSAAGSLQPSLGIILSVMLLCLVRLGWVMN
eukprot:GILJ01017325.1.p1 GENE.GILJ01017325.1~~GILJ01017325.1.p1  ORF type:complete len:1675 (-),score=261.66 GILJ01017325.1:80-4660(-)